MVEILFRDILRLELRRIFRRPFNTDCSVKVWVHHGTVSWYGVEYVRVRVRSLWDRGSCVHDTVDSGRSPIPMGQAVSTGNRDGDRAIVAAAVEAAGWRVTAWEHFPNPQTWGSYTRTHVSIHLVGSDVPAEMSGTVRTLDDDR